MSHALQNLPNIREVPYISIDNFLPFFKESTAYAILTHKIGPEGPFTIDDFEPRRIPLFAREFKSEISPKIERIIMRHIASLHEQRTFSNAGSQKLADYRENLIEETTRKFDLFFEDFKSGLVNTNDIPIPDLPDLKLKKRDFLGRPLRGKPRELYVELITTRNSSCQFLLDRKNQTKIVVDLARSIWKMLWLVGDFQEQYAFIMYCTLKGISLDTEFDITDLKKLTTKLIQKNKEIKAARNEFTELLNAAKQPVVVLEDNQPEVLPSPPDVLPPAQLELSPPVDLPDPEALKRKELTLSLNRSRHKLDCRVTRFDIPFAKIHMLEGFQDPDRHGRPCFKYQYPYKEKTPELEERHLNFLIEQWQNHNAPVESLFRLPKEVIEEYSYPQIHESPNHGDQPGRWCDCTKVTGMGTPNEKRVKGVLTVATDQDGVMYHRVFVPTEKVDFNLLKSPQVPMKNGVEEKAEEPEQPFKYQNGRHREALPNGDLAFIFGHDGDPHQAVFLVHKKREFPFNKSSD